MEVISQEFIKPISPTPNHLKTYQFSMLDQFAPANYIPILLYYPPVVVQHHNQNPKRLKNSLSEILVHYYPLAGRLGNDNTFVDCNDEGVPFLEAHVHNQRLEDFLNDHENKIRNKSFLPLTANSFSSNLLLVVQVTSFECGGMIVGISASHKLFDAPSLTTFLTDWSALARRHDVVLTQQPLVPLAKFVPLATNKLPPSPNNESAFSSEACITNIYVFNPSSIAQLKSKAASDSVPLPSRVEVVTSTVWSCLSAANSKRPTSLVAQLVNLRRRADPPMHDHHIGNFIGVVVAAKQQSEKDIASMVATLRKGLLELDNKYVEKFKGDENTLLGFLMESASLVTKRDEMDFYIFSSWCGYSFYDLDFGWGKPIMVSTIEATVTNSVTLIDTKDGGVEAWVTLTEGDMKMFEKNKELLTYATLKASLSQKE